MAQKWEDIKTKIEKFATNAADKASEITKEAAERAEQLTKHGKIKLDIYQLEKSRDKEYQKLGKVIFEKITSGELTDLNEHDDIQKITKQVNKINADIKIEDEKLNHLKQEKEEKKDDSNS